MGNGPFKLKDWVLNRSIVVEKNEHYWDADTVKLQQIVFYPIQNATTEERMFRAGQLHITSIMPVDKIMYYRQEKPETLKISPFFSTYYYLFNTSAPPLDRVKVRQALAMSIDRQQIVEKITLAGEIPAFTYTPPEINGYTAKPGLRYDVEQARALLAEAGYPGGAGFPVHRTDVQHIRGTPAYRHRHSADVENQPEYRRHPGKPGLEGLPGQGATQKITRWPRAGWIGDYLDPNTFLDMFTSNSGNNDAGWSNRRYDALIAQAAATSDQERRFALFQDAETILMTELPIMPIYTYVSKSLVSPDVRGWYPNILDIHPYKNISLVPSADD